MATAIAPRPDLESEIYESQLLTGTPVSPGIVAGHARVLFAPDAGYVAPGSVHSPLMQWPKTLSNLPRHCLACCSPSGAGPYSMLLKISATEVMGGGKW